MNYLLFFLLRKDFFISRQLDRSLFFFSWCPTLLNPYALYCYLSNQIECTLAIVAPNIYRCAMLCGKWELRGGGIFCTMKKRAQNLDCDDFNPHLPPSRLPLHCSTSTKFTIALWIILYILIICIEKSTPIHIGKHTDKYHD